VGPTLRASDDDHFPFFNVKTCAKRNSVVFPVANTPVVVISAAAKARRYYREI